jgi:ankyrin repeat protein
VRSFFDVQGDLTRGATPQQLIAGFAWACEFGRTAVVDYLLQRGVAIDARLPHDGQTGLHWAALGGHASTVELLLSRGAPVNLKDPTHDGTPLGWALYGWGGSRPPGEQPDYYTVVARLVAAGAIVDSEWLSEDDRGFPLARRVREDPRMRAALGEKS